MNLFCGPLIPIFYTVSLFMSGCHCGIKQIPVHRYSFLALRHAKASLLEKEMYGRWFKIRSDLDDGIV